MIRSSCSVSATSVKRFFPSAAVIFNCTIFSYSSLPSAANLRFKSLQYLLGLSVPLNTSHTSTTEKYHSSFSSFHAVLILLSSNICILLSICITSVEEPFIVGHIVYDVPKSQISIHAVRQFIEFALQTHSITTRSYFQHNFFDFY